MVTANYLTSKEAASYLNVPVKHIYTLCERKRLTYYRPNGGKMYFTVADLRRYMEQCKVPTA